MTQHTKNGPYLWQEADNGILTVEAGCTVVMSSSLINYAGLAGWSVEESWAGIQGVVSSGSLLEKIGSICGKEKEK